MKNVISRDNYTIFREMIDVNLVLKLAGVCGGLAIVALVIYAGMWLAKSPLFQTLKNFMSFFGAAAASMSAHPNEWIALIIAGIALAIGGPVVVAVVNYVRARAENQKAMRSAPEKFTTVEIESAGPNTAEAADKTMKVVRVTTYTGDAISQAQRVEIENKQAETRRLSLKLKMLGRMTNEQYEMVREENEPATREEAIRAAQEDLADVDTVYHDVYEHLPPPLK